jgi:protease-4
MRILFRLLRALFKLVFFPVLLLRRKRAAGASGYLELEIDGQIVDITPPRRLFALQQRRAVSLLAIADLAEEIARDERAKGIVVHLRSLRGGMAAAQSLRDVLSRIRVSGREVVVHMPDGGDTKAVYVSTAASRVIVGPQATLTPLGFAIRTAYFRGGFDRLGLTPEILAHGKYKSAGEQLVRSSMSEPQREQVEALVAQMYETLLDAIAEGRSVGPERARAIVDGAPYLADEAVAAGLADRTAYEDELATPKATPAARYVAARRATRLGPVLPESIIGVVRVHGAIVHGGAGALAVSVATDTAVVRAVRAARSSRRVRGVILHIDSPGGSALASDRMHHELVQLAKEKPLVACMANVAASGGYYVAAAAHAIVAQPTTMTGSIGVVAARVALEPLLTRLGVVSEVIKRGAHAELVGTTRLLTDDERDALMREIDGVYRAFVRVVAEGRKRTVEEIEKVAQGRVWTGREARDVGLVDRLGGFDVALGLVRERLGPGGSRLRPVVVTPPMRALPPLDPATRKAAEILAAWRVLAAAVTDASGLGLHLSSLALLAASGERTLAWSALAASAGSAAGEAD